MKATALEAVALFCPLMALTEERQVHARGDSVVAHRYFDANRLTYVIRNDGLFGHHSVYGTNDFRQDSAWLVYSSGPWMGATVDGQIRAACADFTTDSVGGAIDPTGRPIGKGDSTFRVYKIFRGNTPASNPHYAQWLKAFGAPSDDHENPVLLGDQTRWCSFVDAYAEDRVGDICPPQGVEVHATFRGWKTIDDILFSRLLLFNKSLHTWRDCYAGLYSDADVQDVSPNLVGRTARRTSCTRTKPARAHGGGLRVLRSAMRL